MDKKCYVCGKTIHGGKLYYSVGPNSYVCDNEDCYNFYFWDSLAARMVHNRFHEYVIVDGEVYQIGSDDDSPRGFGGRHWAIRFNDGYYVETNSLWHRGKLPERLIPDFPDNAIFVE